MTGTLKDGTVITNGQRIKFTMNFWDGREHGAYWSEDGFEGTVTWDKWKFVVTDVVYRKPIDDPDYVFGLTEWQLTRVKSYSTIKTADIEEISYVTTDYPLCNTCSGTGETECLTLDGETFYSTCLSCDGKKLQQK